MPSSAPGFLVFVFIAVQFGNPLIQAADAGSVLAPKIAIHTRPVMAVALTLLNGVSVTAVAKTSKTGVLFRGGAHLYGVAPQLGLVARGEVIIKAVFVTNCHAQPPASEDLTSAHTSAL